MRSSRRRYQNPLRAAALFRWVVLAAVIGCIGGSFVFVRNRHVARGDEILAVEEEIRRLDREIEMVELSIASLLNRAELSKRLQASGSDLVPIEPPQVVTLRPEASGRASRIARSE